MNEDQAERMIKLLESIDGKLSSTAVIETFDFGEDEEGNVTMEPPHKREEVATSVAEHLGKLYSMSRSLAQYPVFPHSSLDQYTSEYNNPIPNQSLFIYQQAQTQYTNNISQ